MTHKRAAEVSLDSLAEERYREFSGFDSTYMPTPQGLQANNVYPLDSLAPAVSVPHDTYSNGLHPNSLGGVSTGTWWPTDFTTEAPECTVSNSHNVPTDDTFSDIMPRV
jgi:hypothetical protein